MATISKIRLANILYEGGLKRYNDETFVLDSNNTAFILENGGGKTVLVQMILQAVLPRHNHSGRKIWETLQLSSGAAHIAVEWLLDQRPRRYLLTAVTLYMKAGTTASNLYVTEYTPDEKGTIEDLPFSVKTEEGNERPASSGEINDYYLKQKNERFNSKTFDTIKSYQAYLEKNYQLSYKEWLSISKINSSEGGIEDFFDNCATTPQLVNNLLIPTIEDAIEGENTELFADIFEEHRQHIKEYKRLTRVIEENRHIQSNLNDYVGAYQVFHLENEAFDEKKAVIKGLYNRAISDQKEIDHKQMNVLNEIEALEKQYFLWQEKKTSYDIALETEKKLLAERIYLESEGKLNQLLSSIERTDYTIDKLSLSKRIQEHATNKMKIQGIDRQLATMDASVDAQVLIEEKDNFESQLLDVFNKECRTYQDRKEALERELTFLLGQLNTAKVQHDTWMEEKNALNGDIGKMEGILGLTKKALETCKNKLLYLENFEDARDFRDGCSKKIRDLSLEQENIKSIILECQAKINDLEEGCHQHNEESRRLEGVKSSIEERLKGIDQENMHLYKQFNDLSGKPLVGRDLYTSSQDITQFINQALSILNDEREILIGQEAEYNFKEKIFFDIDTFVADPSLKKKVELLKKQFSYVETGVAYLSNHYEATEIKAIYEHYASWPITLVTIESEKDQVWQRLMLDRDQMEYPIIVLSDKEVQSIVEGKLPSLNQLQVMPKSWLDNLNAENFNKWKAENKEKLDAYKEKRKNHEDKIENYQNYLSRMKEFLDKCPFGMYEDLRDRLSAVVSSLNKEEEGYAAKQALIKENRKRLSDKRKRQEVVTEEKRAHDRQLELIIEVLDLLKGHEEASSNLKKLNKRLKILENDLEETHGLIDALRDKEDDLKEERRAVDSEIDLVHKDPYFIQVREKRPLLAQYSKDALKVRLENIEKQLNGIVGQRQELEKSKGDLLKTSYDLAEEIEAYQEKVNQSIYKDEILLLGNGRKQIKDAEYELRNLKQLEKDQRHQVEALKSDFDRLSGGVEKMTEDFYLKYKNLMTFEEPLDLLIESLNQEEGRLLSQKKVQEKNLEEIKSLQLRIEQVIGDLERKHEKYDYLEDKIKAIDLSEGLENDYKYDHLKTTTTLIQGLAYHSRKLEDAFNKKEDQKEVFKNFCLTGISDPKLKQSTVSFINSRESYEDLCQWQSKIQDKIGQVLKMSAISLQEVDKEIVKLIDRLYIYLTKVIQELSLLESKTRIKLKNDNKRIFKMTTPDFSEPIAKQAIRDHLIWMTTKIQEGDYSNDDGSENTSEMKKDVTSWLSTKTLLSKIFLSKDITVKCRKVTNDFQIKGQLTDWGHTNKWSGGEKWSKNMTLYLGIQNYLAEKRYVDVTKNKRNRTVLLDNPFGAASSGHVLEPVFLIAEQLGYQLIALTAHSQGKFISDYFPIVYSCKLRLAKDNRIQIMTKQKEINYAFLRDHNPMSIQRLEEEERRQLYFGG